jgi:PleD family two-component response regulator
MQALTITSIPVSLKVLLARIRAGQRIINLQHEIQKERRDLQRYIAELALSNRRLELMANTDALTGLSNRRYSLNRLDQEWATAQRNRTLSASYCLIWIISNQSMIH